VDLRLNTAVTGFEAGDQGHVAGVTLADGGTVPADIVLVSVGVVPETALAEAAGLPCDDGIIVDEFTRTEDPAILAIGDCTRHRNLFFEKMQRLESVANAVDQARTAAAAPTRIRDLRCSISATAVSLPLTQSTCQSLLWSARHSFNNAGRSILKC